MKRKRPCSEYLLIWPAEENDVLIVNQGFGGSGGGGGTKNWGGLQKVRRAFNWEREKNPKDELESWGC